MSMLCPGPSGSEKIISTESRLTPYSLTIEGVTSAGGNACQETNPRTIFPITESYRFLLDKKWFLENARNPVNMACASRRRFTTDKPSN
jgi:hypothetical protein